MQNSKSDPSYLRLPAVARRLGLGQVRRPRRDSPPGGVLSTDERLARAVRSLIKSGTLKAVKDQGTWLVREDWLEEYEALRIVRSRWPSLKRDLE